MAKRKGSRRHKSFTLPLAVVAGFAPTAIFALQGAKLPGAQGGIEEAAHRLTMRMTGYEWKGNLWSGAELMKGWLPMLAGFFTHKLANKMGINRAISGAGIPFIRI